MSRDRGSADRPAFELPPSKGRIGRAIDDELAFHLEERVRELVASGMDPGSARAQAAAQFGDLDTAREELCRIDELAARRSFMTEAVADLWSDVTRSTRALVHRPGYALAATITLALGIGANAAMFGMVDRLLLSPPAHIRDAERVVRMRVDEAQPQGDRILWSRVPAGYFREIAQARPGFDVAGYTTLALTLRIGSNARDAAVVATTPGYFALLGTQPARGRLLLDSDAGDAGDARAVVISHAMWSRDLASTPDVIGRDITLGAQSFHVVGVAPRGFTGDGIEAVDAWIPLTPTTPGVPRASANDRIAVLARLRAGVSPAAASAVATQRYRALQADAARPDSTARVVLHQLTPGRTPEGTMTAESRVALWLQGVSVLVLLIAVANVANLLLLRSIERRRETAVRIALGVSRVRLVRHVVLESVLLGGAAAMLAAALVRLSAPVLWRVLLPLGAEPSTNPWQDGFAVALLAFGSALAMTIVPALLQLGTPTIDVLRGGGRGASRRGTVAGDVLVVVQVACAVVLLVGSGLFLRSLFRLTTLDFGFDLDRVVAIRVDLSQARADRVAVERLARAAEERVASVPGVERAALSLTAPYRPSLSVPVFLPGRAELPGVGPRGLGYPSFFAVGPEFFATMGVGVLQGRSFGTADAATAPRVVIVDATMARTFWPNANAIGQCLRLGADTAPCRTVVGIVQDTKRSPIGQVHGLRYYLPLTQAPGAGGERYVFARASGSVASLLAPVRAAAVSAAAQAFVEVFPLKDVLEPYTRPWRLGRAVFVAFGVLSTVIATIGLYGVIAFGVAQRRRELGIRIALGASRASVLQLVASGAGVRAAAGAVVGVGGAIILGKRLHDLLFETSGTDVVVFTAALLVVALATLVACALPAWRAVRVDPTVSLRMD